VLDMLMYINVPYFLVLGDTSLVELFFFFCLACDSNVVVILPRMKAMREGH